MNYTFQNNDFAPSQPLEEIDSWQLSELMFALALLENRVLTDEDAELDEDTVLDVATSLRDDAEVCDEVVQRFLSVAQQARDADELGEAITDIRCLVACAA